MTALNRSASLEALANETFDLVIIGGGITGACLAFDASTRGLKTALVERRDFGHATSSASSKLLHGGIRFLQQFRVDKVRESAFERVYFQNLVPHLCRYVPFVIPTFAGLKEGRAFLGAGALAYSMIAAGQNRRAKFAHTRVPLPRLVGRAALDEMVPWLDDDWPATGGLVLPECHMQSSERVTLALVQAAAEHGCTVCNYAEVSTIDEDGGRVTGVTVSTGETPPFAVRSAAVANCGGPWLSRINGLTGGDESGPITSFFRGSHLVLRNWDLSCALALPTAQKIKGVAGRGGRHVFLIPWRGHVMLGTSYASHSDDLDDVRATREDTEQLLDAVNSALDGRSVSEDDIVHAWSGLYPLTAAEVKSDVYQGASDYLLTDVGQRGGPQNYFTLFGAKYTTARKLAELGCNLIVKRLGKAAGPCLTRAATVAVADVDDPTAYCARVAEQHAGTFDRATVDHLFQHYGTALEKVLAVAGELANPLERLSAERPNLAAEAVHCARDEMIAHLDDFVFRRTGMGTIGNPGAAALSRCAALIGGELNWSAPRIQAEVAATLARFERPL
ncbi:MAG: glycerol-3-phosphate dehydrogenase/oxidase [Pseudomonadota bacterium]